MQWTASGIRSCAGTCPQCVLTRIFRLRLSRLTGQARWGGRASRESDRNPGEFSLPTTSHFRPWTLVVVSEQGLALQRPLLFGCRGGPVLLCNRWWKSPVALEWTPRYVVDNVKDRELGRNLTRVGRPSWYISTHRASTTRQTRFSWELSESRRRLWTPTTSIWR